MKTVITKQTIDGLVEDAEISFCTILPTAKLVNCTLTDCWLEDCYVDYENTYIKFSNLRNCTFNKYSNQLISKCYVSEFDWQTSMKPFGEHEGQEVNKQMFHLCKFNPTEFWVDHDFVRPEYEKVDPNLEGIEKSIDFTKTRIRDTF